MSESFEIKNNVLIKYTGDKSVTSIVVPEGVTEIGYGAFRDLDASSLTLPQSLVNITNTICVHLDNLKEINIKKGTTSIYFEGFNTLKNLTSINIEEGNPRYFSVDGIVYSSLHELVLCPRGRSGTVEIAEGTLSIPRGSISRCDKITDIKLPNSLKESAERSFKGLKSLQSITFPSNLKGFDFNALDDSPLLETIDLSQSYYYKEENGAIYYISTDDKLLVYIMKKHMDTLTLLEDTTDCVFGVFDNCNIDNLIIPSNFDALKIFNNHFNIFGNCENIKNIIFEDRNLKLFVGWWVENDYVDATAIKKFLKYAHCFYPSQLDVKLVKLSLSSVCSAMLDERYISEKWKTMWLDLIKTILSDLTTVLLKELSVLKLVTREKLLNLTDTKELIEVAQSLEKTEAVSILLDYENNAFSMDEIIEDKEKELLQDQTSVEYNKKRWMWQEKGKNGILLTEYIGRETDIIVPEKIGDRKVTAIDIFCFSPSNAVRKYKIRRDIQKTRENITSVIFPSTVTSIDEGAFLDCKKLNHVELPPKLRSRFRSLSTTPIYSEGIFQGCTNLKTVTIPEKMEKIPPVLFNRSCIESIEIPSNVKEISFCAFLMCANLKEVKLNEGLEIIGEYNFLELEEITIPRSVIEIRAEFREDAVIKGYRNTVAEQVAKEQNLKFVPLD